VAARRASSLALAPAMAPAYRLQASPANRCLPTNVDFTAMPP
jgi:hypothetical protein